jgi:hypothetical protein
MLLRSVVQCLLHCEPLITTAPTVDGYTCSKGDVLV